MFFQKTAVGVIGVLTAQFCVARPHDGQVGSTFASGDGGTNPNAQGATSDVEPGSGPNGSEDWLNTGIKGSGWDPPYLSFDTLVLVDKNEFYQTVGSQCQQYDSYFEESGSKYSINPVVLACIAMQESSCNADAGGPSPGLMQVACDNYPDHTCAGHSVADNVDAGAHYLSQMLNDSNNNAIEAIGAYNGWFTAGSGLNGNNGLTESYPCSSEGRSNGEPQNLDYLQQTLNGWFQGKDVYGDDSWIGTYQCQGTCNGDNLC